MSGIPAVDFVAVAFRVFTSSGLILICLSFGMDQSGSAAELQEVAGQQTAETIDYSRDIRPILSASCFACHGPDSESREADLRLDRDIDAYADLGSGSAIVPGEPGESLVVERILADDDFERMPPADFDKDLTAEQIRMIQQWIAQGAKYTEHWAFRTPVRPALPAVTKADWPRNAIDFFVLARLEAIDLEPSPEVDRYTLVRRVYLDLIGLPPTPEEADAFVHDTSSDAYEQLVDRLLASPHYGERWARRWLDLARYSDTNGYEKDRQRSIWPYRDWIIDALNRDMPFDQFTVEQIAGDMLPDATASQRIATGFHRNTMVNEEGGIDPEEYRFLATVDRVATTGTTWLGLTVGCAQCHSHKYDPISQEEYYGFFALLNNANELLADVPNEEVRLKRQEIVGQIEALEAGLAAQFPLPAAEEGNSEATESAANGPGATASARRAESLAVKFQAWQEQATKDAVAWSVCPANHVNSNLPSVDTLADGSVLISGDQTKNDTFLVNLTSVPGVVTAIRLETLPHDSLPEHGPGRRVVGQGASAGVGDFFLTKFRLSAVDPSGKIRDLPLHDASETFAAKDRSAALALDDRGDTGWSIAGRPGERHVAVFRLVEPVELQADEQFQVRLEHESFYPSGLGHFRLAATTDPRPIKASVVPDEIERLLLDLGQRKLDHQSRLRDYYLSIAPELVEQHKNVAALRKSMPAYPTTLVLAERPQRHARATHLHHRGEFLKPKQAVEPCVPSMLPPLPSNVDTNRLTFARWLVARDNPLVARVTVNRQWQGFFGRGIVRTTEDFGMQGELPTHPQLLDWMAIEFMERDWSLKHLHRLIVTSATYRQTARINELLARRDPENESLTRGPRFRLDAELIRDALLRVSGLLSRKIGGPGVFPSQPSGITEAAYGPLDWVLSQKEDRYRRGLYTFSKRTAPYVAFGLFDAPSGESCTARRINSNTPLQALNLLNDPVVIEAARALGRDVLATEIDEDRARASYLMRRCLTRPPEPSELEVVLSFFCRQRDQFLTGTKSPVPIVGAGFRREWTFADGPDGWEMRNQLEMVVRDGKLILTSTGNDPFLGTRIDGPAGRYQLTIRAKFGTKSDAQVFWTTRKNPAEGQVQPTTFKLIPDEWHTYQVPLEFDSALSSLRLDPGSEECVSEIESVRLEYGDLSVKIPESTSLPDLAAWTLVARGLLNLDEMITKP